MNDLHIFNLYWATYDEDLSVLLHHPNKTAEDFDSDVKQTARQVCREAVKSKTDDWSDECGPRPVFGGDSLFDAVQKQLVEKLGYKVIKFPTSELPTHGQIFNNKHPEPEWQEYLGSDLYEQIADKAAAFFAR